MSKDLKIGILGGGGILGAHGPGFMDNIDSCTVAMIAEPNKDRHGRIRELIGNDVEIVPDYRNVLAESSIEAVDIILPHYLHMPATVDAANAGKHVLVEKVMARNIWECDRMIEACDTAGVTLTVCHDRRYHGQWEALKTIVDSGVLGEVFFWKLDHNQNVIFPEGTWVRTRDGIGGGCIMSCLTHQIDALRWYAGEFDSLTCMTRITPDRMEGESLGVIIATMADGALAELSINWRTKSNVGENCLWYEMAHACGTKGEAYYMSNRGGTFVKLNEDADSDAVERYGKEALEGFVAVECAPYKGHTKCITEWLKLAAGKDADIRTNGRDCRGTVEVAEAAYLSVDEKRVVSLPIEPKPWEDSCEPVDGGNTGAASYHIDK